MAFQPFEHWTDANLRAEVPTVPLRNGFFTQDNLGALLGVNVYDGHTEHVLTGSAPYYVKLADGTTLEGTGTISGNKASVTLPSEAYAAVGPITVIIANRDGTKQKALAIFNGYVFETKTDAQVAPGQVVADLAQLQALYEEMSEEVAQVEVLLDGVARIQDDQQNNGINIIF